MDSLVPNEHKIVNSKHILKILKNWNKRFPYFDIIMKPKPEAG
jgi:hypothetical protein